MVRMVRVSGAGRITIPADVLRAIGAGLDTKFLLVQDRDFMVLLKDRDVERRAESDLDGWEALAVPSFSELWSGTQDDAWGSA